MRTGTAVLVLALVTSCSSDPPAREAAVPAPVAPAPTPVASSRPPTAGPTGSTAGPTSSTAGPTGSVPAPGTPTPGRTPTAAPTFVLRSLTFVALPSGNVVCALDEGTARCDIRERTWEPPPKPASCELDYGSGLSLGDGRAGVVCAGDTVLTDTATPLPYGSAVRTGDVVCSSSTEGMRCENLRTSRGFVLARAEYRLF